MMMVYFTHSSQSRIHIHIFIPLALLATHHLTILLLRSLLHHTFMTRMSLHDCILPSISRHCHFTLAICKQFLYYALFMITIVNPLALPSLSIFTCFRQQQAKNGWLPLGREKKGEQNAMLAWLRWPLRDTMSECREKKEARNWHIYSIF